MKKVENGHFVKVDYTGTLENGDVFDTSRNSHPIEVEIGAGKVIKGFEDALKGMAQDEKKTFTSHKDTDSSSRVVLFTS